MYTGGLNEIKVKCVDVCGGYVENRMKIELTQELNVCVIKPYGPINYSTLARFNETLNRSIDEGSNKILLNFAEVDFISTLAIRALMEANKKIVAKQGTIAVCSLSKELRELFDVIQLDRIFPVFNDSIDAIHEMKQSSKFH